MKRLYMPHLTGKMKVSRAATNQQLGYLGYLEYDGRKPRTIKEADALIKAQAALVQRAREMHAILDASLDFYLQETM